LGEASWRGYGLGPILPDVKAHYARVEKALAGKRRRMKGRKSKSTSMRGRSKPTKGVERAGPVTIRGSSPPKEFSWNHYWSGAGLKKIRNGKRKKRTVARVRSKKGSEVRKEPPR